MNLFDVRSCVIDALPNQHAARAFARRFPGKVHLAYYGEAQKGHVSFGRDQDGSSMVTISRTEHFDAWRDAYLTAKRRIPRYEGEVIEYVRQMTNILRTIKEDPETGDKRARYIRRGPDHYAHADAYADVAFRRLHHGFVKVTIIG
jgi:hypothetical protein